MPAPHTLPVSQVSRTDAPCFMPPLVDPVHPDFAGTQEAWRDFTHQQGAPYALLYIEKTAGHPDRDRCWRVMQGTRGQWTAYRYQGARVDSLSLLSQKWLQLLTAVRSGHYAPSCSSFSSATVTSVLLVKQDQTTSFSMALNLLEWKQLSAEQQALLQLELNVVRHL